ncbi:MAG: hypothetical protein ABH881_03255 [bacterium]
MKKIIILFCGIILILPMIASANIGVGVGTGKIRVDQPMKAGLIYTLPSYTIINTGDEPSEYGVGTQYHEDQPEMRAPRDWFSFEPMNFYLEPGQVQVVQVKLSLPIRGAKPGDYFCFLQGFPVKKADVKGTSVGVAAAAKLYFTVAPANVFTGIYYRVGSLLKLYSPWSYVVSSVIIAALLIALFRRFFSFNLGVSLKKK